MDYDIAHLILEITERGAVTQDQRANILTPSGRLKKVLSGNNRVLFKKRRL